MKKGIVLKLAMFVVAFAISTFAPSMTAAAASYDDEFVALIKPEARSKMVFSRFL